MGNFRGCFLHTSDHHPAVDKASPAGAVDEIAVHEIDEVAEFLARLVRPGEAKIAGALPPAERLRWLLLDNPRRQPDIPLGWRIRGERGAIVGAAVCIPFLIGSGEFRATALMFAKFFVDPPYRGMGLGLLMRFIREGRRFPLFCTSTNAIAGELFKKLGAAQIPQMDHTMLGVDRARPLAEELLVRKLGRPMLARLLSLPAAFAPTRIGHRSSAQLRKIDSVDALGNIGSTQAEPIAVVRDRDYLHWRYFTGDRDKHVYCFDCGDNAKRLIVVNEVRSGHRGQIRVVNVLDVWPPAGPTAAVALAGALARAYRGRFDAIWLRSQPVEAEKALSAAGFRRHNFPAPLGWFIDKPKRLPAGDWYSVPGESE